MEIIELLLTISFITGSLLSMYWGVYLIRLNQKLLSNRVFFLISTALSIWLIGFALSNIANSLTMALFWRRFASIGMTALFSLIFHFSLLLTGQADNQTLNKKLLLLYIPGLICMYIFSFSSKMAVIQYDLVQTNYGVINVASNTLWNYFYYFYYSMYMILGLGIIWKWKEKLRDQKHIRQANLIIVTILASAIFGTLTDVILNTLLSDPFPQIAPLFILLPVWALYHSARYYGILNIDQIRPTEIIVTAADRKKIFKNIIWAFYAGAVISFGSEYLFNMGSANNLRSALLKSMVLTGLGIAMQLSQQIQSEEFRERVTITVLITSIPLVTLQFIEYGSITVWVFPVIIIISAIIFSKLTLLILTTVASIMTQILMWLMYPEVTVVVDQYDYIVRIGMFLLAFIIGLYINKLYLAKIKENQAQIEFQEIISEILFDFIDINQENVEAKINRMLHDIGVFFNVDRTYLFTIDHRNQTMTYANEWCNKGIQAEVGTINEIPLDTFPWWIEQLNQKQLVYIKDVNRMPATAKEEQQQLHRQGVKSLISVPVMGEGEILAFIGIDSVLAKKQWSAENIEMLNIMAKILYGGLMQVEADKEIEFMAYYDHLTKLPNRFLFDSKVNEAIKKSKENYIAVIFIDLDNFKTVNDTIGHKGGDSLLKQVAKILTNKLRESDIMARFGGDEFMIMLNDVKDYQTIIDIAERIVRVFDKLFTLEEQEFRVTASAGIAVYPYDGEDTNTLVKNADLAMYEAKAKGKNQYALCTEEIKAEMKEYMDLTNDLSYAIERNELILHYQPQMDLTENKIIGVEALVRWNHPTRGMISPGIFIPIAEDNNLINSIGEWVLKTACLQNKKWQEMGLSPVIMAVNLSAAQIVNPRIVAIVENVLNETGLDPKYLELEITETVAIREADYVIDILNQLKDLGVSIAIDDFGTEYSSLSRLKLLPIDRIKIDMQFIQGIETNEKDRAITMVIIKLAKSMGLHVLAEGVETVEQLEYLNEKKCEQSQGFYHYKPVPAEELEQTLANYQ